MPHTGSRNDGHPFGVQAPKPASQFDLRFRGEALVDISIPIDAADGIKRFRTAADFIFFRASSGSCNRDARRTGDAFVTIGLPIDTTDRVILHGARNVLCRRRDRQQQRDQRGQYRRSTEWIHEVKRSHLSVLERLKPSQFNYFDALLTADHSAGDQVTDPDQLDSLFGKQR